LEEETEFSVLRCSECMLRRHRRFGGTVTFIASVIWSAMIHAYRDA
jgi:hypothetical protein